MRQCLGSEVSQAETSDGITGLRLRELKATVPACSNISRTSCGGLSAGPVWGSKRHIYKRKWRVQERGELRRSRCPTGNTKADSKEALRTPDSRGANQPRLDALARLQRGRICHALRCVCQIAERANQPHTSTRWPDCRLGAKSAARFDAPCCLHQDVSLKLRLDLDPAVAWTPLAP